MPKWLRTKIYGTKIETDMKRIGISLILILACAMAFAQDEVVDYLHVGKTLKFQDKKFELKWCQHPIEAFYLQEWLPKGETFDNYEQMLSVSLSFSETLSVKFFVDAKVKELEERKKSDKCCLKHEETIKKNCVFCHFCIYSSNAVLQYTLSHNQI